MRVTLRGMQDPIGETSRSCDEQIGTQQAGKRGVPTGGMIFQTHSGSTGVCIILN